MVRWLRKDAHCSVRCAVERAIRLLRTWRILTAAPRPATLLGHILRDLLVLETRRAWT